MRDIEKLFSRELDIIEARTVHPEYGFTESMTDFITTSAYATVASLLIFGSQRGTCAVAAGTGRPSMPTEEAPVKPVFKAPAAPKHEEEAPKIPVAPAAPVHPTPAPAEPTKSDEEDEPWGTEPEPKSSWRDKFKKRVAQLGNSFMGSDEDDF